MSAPVVTVASGGLPVVDVTATFPKLGLPVIEAANGRGIAVTKTTRGLPVTYEFTGPTAPVAYQAAYVGGNVVITLTQAVDPAFVPATSAFAFTPAGTPTGVSISGSTVTLTTGLSNITNVTYTAPGTNMLKGLGTGLNVANFTLPVTGGGVTAMAISQDATNNRLYQRTPGGTSSGTLALAGTYTGGAPASVQAQVFKVSDNSVVKAWTTLTGGSISGGNWSGSFGGVPQGGPYYLKVRASDATTVIATGAANWYVGAIVMGYGQSNMNHMFGNNSGSPPAPSAGTVYWSAGGGWAAPPAADAIRTYANTLLGTAGFPICVVNCSLDGAPTDLLVPGSTQWNTVLLPTMTAVGDVEMMIVDHGEGDANAGYTGATWTTNWGTIASSLRTLTGRTGPQLPLVFTGMGTQTAGVPDAAWNVIQTAILQVPGNIANSYVSHNTYDLTRVDGYHYDTPGLVKQGQRFAKTCQQLLSGSTTGFPAWNITSSAVVDATHSTVDFVHSLGTDFTPTSAITGFEVSGDNGATWSTCTGVRTSATRVTLTHASVATSSLRRLRYLYGGAPVITGLVLDNSAYAEPLNYSGVYLAPTPLATLPVPVVSSMAQNSGSSTTQTRTGISIGAAAARRMVICGLTNHSGVNVLSATVTPNVGTAKTLIADATKQDANGIAVIMHAVLDADADTATTVNFSVTWDADPFSGSVSTFWYLPSADLSSTTAVDGKTAVNNSATALSITNLTTSSGGFIIEAGLHHGFTGGSIVLSGTDSWNTDGQLVAQGAFHCAGNAVNTGAHTTSDTVTMTSTQAADDIKMVAASWR